MSEAILGRAQVVIGAALDQLDKDLGDVKDRVENALSGIAKVAAGITGIGIAALAGGLAVAIGEAMGAQEAMAQLETVLNSLGDQAAVDMDQLMEMAGSLQDVTRFSDESVMAAEAVMLRFTSIGEDVFPRAIEASADLATAMGTDMPNAARYLGLALEAPMEGMSRLRRMGVVFTEEQEKAIAAMVELGDTAGAQSYMLDVLETKYGGAAEAAGQTFAGQIDRLKNRFSDILEVIGGAVLPILSDLAERGFALLGSPQVQQAIATITNLVAGLAYAAYDLFDLFVAGEDDMDAFVEFFATIIGQGAAQQLADIVVDIAAFMREQLIPAIGQFLSHKEVLVALFAIIAAGFYMWASAAIAAAIPTVVAMAPVIAVIAAIGAAAALLYTAWTENWGGIQEKIQAVWGVIQPIFEMIGNVIREVWEGTIRPALEAFAQKVAEWWEVIYPQLQEVWEGIWNVIMTVFTAIKDFIEEHMDTIKGIFESVWGAIHSVIQVVWSLISGIIQTGLSVLRGDWEGAWNAIKGTAEGVWNAIKGFLESIWNTIKGVATLLWDGIKSVIQSPIETVKGWLETTWNTAKTTIEGIWEGIKTKAGELWEGIKGAISEKVLAARDWLADRWTEIKGKAEEIWLQTRDSALEYWGHIKGAINKVSAEIWPHIEPVWDEFWTNMSNIWNSVLDIVRNSSLYDAGQQIIQSLWDGLVSIWQSVVDWWNQNIAPIFGASPPGNTGQGMVPGGITPSGSGFGTTMGESISRSSIPEGSMAGNQWTINIYPQQSTGRVLNDLQVARTLIGV